MKTLRTLMALLGLILTSLPAFAQTTLTSTTLAAALAAGSSQMNVASATGIEVGDYVSFVSKNKVVEGATVRAINGTFITLSRNTFLGNPGGTIAHASGTTIYHAPPAQYFRNSPVGTCTRSAQTFLPHIDMTTGVISQCSTASVWYALHEQISVKCYTGALATGSVDQSCWTVDGDYVITGISYVAKTAEAAGTLTLIPRRQQGTEAPASGDALATALNAVAAGTAAETVTNFTLTATGSLLLLSSGERLGLDFTDDVAGELAGVVVTFKIAPR